MKKLLIHALLASALVGGSAACGSDDATPTETTTTTEAQEETTTTEEAELAFGDWADEVQGICADSGDAIDALGEPADLDELADLAGEAEDLYATAVDDIEALGLPDERADEVGEWLALLADQLALYPDLVDAAASGDEEAVEQAAGEIEEVQTEAQDLATDLGLDECDWSGGDSTTTGAEGELTLDEWVLEADAICDTFSEQAAPIEEALDEVVEVIEYVPLFQEAAGVYEDLVFELRQLGLPRDEPDDVAQWVVLLDDLRPAYQALAEAAATGDASALEAAGEPFAATAEEASAIAEDLGMSACADI